LTSVHRHHHKAGEGVPNEGHAGEKRPPVKPSGVEITLFLTWEPIGCNPWPHP
jgi:hypothetical protein